MNEDSTMERCLGRVEARVADLTEQITALRTELSALTKSVEAAVAGHQERLAALESFRRWAIGLMTGLFLSGAAAVFAYVLRNR
jgi:hypothetical protein